MALFARKEKKKCVLVVDDVSTIRLISAQVFRKAGHEVFEARNGEEALALAREHHPDLIVLDVVMHKKGGVDTLREIRQDSSLKSTPVVMLTGSQDQDVLRELMPLQVADFILKDSLENVMEKLQKHEASL